MKFTTTLFTTGAILMATVSAVPTPQSGGDAGANEKREPAVVGNDPGATNHPGFLWTIPPHTPPHKKREPAVVGNDPGATNHPGFLWTIPPHTPPHKKRDDKSITAGSRGQTGWDDPPNEKRDDKFGTAGQRNTGWSGPPREKREPLLSVGGWTGDSTANEKRDKPIGGNYKRQEVGEPSAIEKRERGRLTETGWPTHPRSVSTEKEIVSGADGSGANEKRDFGGHGLSVGDIGRNEKRNKLMGDHSASVGVGVGVWPGTNPGTNEKRDKPIGGNYKRQEVSERSANEKRHQSHSLGASAGDPSVPSVNEKRHDNKGNCGKRSEATEDNNAGAHGPSSEKRQYGGC